MSAESQGPPFWLVVDGKQQHGAIACAANSTDKASAANNTATFRFDALAGVTYRISAFTRSAKYTLPGVDDFELLVFLSPSWRKRI